MLFSHHLYFTKILGRKANRLGNKQKATIYNSIPKEKKINAEDNRMKVDCVHFIFKKLVCGRLSIRETYEEG